MRQRSSTYSGCCSVVQCGVAAPSEALIGREFPGALAFEEENALAEGVAVVLSGGGRAEREQEEEYGEDGECRKRKLSVSRHFLFLCACFLFLRARDEAKTVESVVI